MSTWIPLNQHVAVSVRAILQFQHLQSIKEKKGDQRAGPVASNSSHLDTQHIHSQNDCSMARGSLIFKGTCCSSLCLKASDFTSLVTKLLGSQDMWLGENLSDQKQWQCLPIYSRWQKCHLQQSYTCFKTRGTMLCDWEPLCNSAWGLTLFTWKHPK